MFTSQPRFEIKRFFSLRFPHYLGAWQADLYFKEFWVSYGTGNILPTLFPKAFGPSNSTFLLVFQALTVCDAASFSAGHRIAIKKGELLLLK